MDSPDKREEQPIPIYKKATKKAKRAEDRALKEAARQQTLSRRRFLKAVAATAAVGIIAAVGGSYIAEQQREKSLKEKVLSFNWKDAKDKEKLASFVGVLAKEYLKLTNTPRLKEEDLTGSGKINFYTLRPEFVEALKKIDPPHTPLATEWGLANPASKRVFIDLTTLERQTVPDKIEAGTALLTAVWHEWCHLDVTEKQTGELINSPLEEYRIISNRTQVSEPFKRYRGGEIHSETDYIFHRWDEVLTETITQRRIAEQVGLERRYLTGNYDQYGFNVLIPFTQSANIPIDLLYNLHATSDVEGQARILGQNLQGNEDSLQKGMRLMDGINRSNPAIISQMGLVPR